MPYKDVYTVGVELRYRIAECTRQFGILSETCEHQIKPTPLKGRYAGVRLMRHCALTGNNVKLECCTENCRALLE